MTTRTAVFTICSNNYQSQADVFCESVRRAHPEADLFLGLADEPVSGERRAEDVTIIPADRLGIPDFRVVAFSYDIMEFNTAIKPYIILHLFELGYDRVLYFDPDIVLFRRLDSIIDALDGGASFVLTPHLCSPPSADAPRNEVDVMRTGVFNLGFLACSQTAETEPMLRWWARKLRYECFNDQTAGIFVDQKFMDLLPGFTDHAKILRDPTMNVAYWNVAQRPIEAEGATWTVAGEPIGFFHFSGFDPENPTRLSKHVQQRPIAQPLQSLLQYYADLRLAKGSGSLTPYAYGRFASGTPIPTDVRHMFRESHRAWPGDPFVDYEAFCRLPSPHAVPGTAGEIVTNFMHYKHSGSAELRTKFDLGDRGGVAAFRRWFVADARRRDVPSSLI